MTLATHTDFSRNLDTIADTTNVPAGVSRTGTGLDGLLSLVAQDQALNLFVTPFDIQTALSAMAELNAIIVQAIHETGIAADGEISTPDLFQLSTHITANYADAWALAHGDDEAGEETGFHLVQNDGANTQLFGSNAINTVIDGLYHLGFGYTGNHLINEDGNRNVQVDDAAFWLNALLARDIAAGVFAGDTAPAPIATTGTGLDALVAMVLTDEGLNQRLPLEELRAGAEAANTMNTIIIEGIKALGLANDGTFDPANVTALADWIRANHFDAFVAAHGDDEGSEETGFHLVQNDGANTRLFGENGVNTVADGIYHLVFGYTGTNLINEDGNRNANTEDVADWLNRLLADDMAALANGDVAEYVEGTTSTGLDRLISLIAHDEGLRTRASDADIRDGAEAANTMNAIIIEGIEALGLGDDGTLSRGDVMSLSDWIAANRYEAFVAAHGDDEGAEETGFHLVQNDGSTGRIFNQNAVNTVADGIYHLVFGYSRGRLVNEDGNLNVSIGQVSYWLNALLAEDLSDWRAAAGNGETVLGTGLDRLVAIIGADPILAQRIPLTEVLDGMATAQGMNDIIIEAIKATGVAANGEISVADVREISDWINANRYEDWLRLHGDDEAGEETGFHLVQNDGANTRLYGDNAVNTVADGIYHLGFGYDRNRLINEDGNANVTLTDVSYWLNDLLADDLADGSLVGAVDPYDVATTGTGLDVITQALFSDDVLTRKFTTSELAQAATAADGLNDILLQAIHQTGAANDGVFDENDVRLISAWIADNALDQWDALWGADSTDSDGFGKVQYEGATSSFDGDNLIDRMARTLYGLGHDIRYDVALYDQTNRYVGRVEDAATYLNQLLADDLDSGALVNSDIVAAAEGSFDDALIAEMTTPLVLGDGQQAVQIAHDAAQEVDQGAIAITFTSDTTEGWDRRTLLSKDYRSYGDGGHLTITVRGGRIEATMQSGDTTYTLSSPKDVLVTGAATDLVLNFGTDGAQMYVDGALVAENADAAITWALNDSPIAIGESRQWARNDSLTNYGLFDGEISVVRIYNRNLTAQEVLTLDTQPEQATPQAVALPSGSVQTVGAELSAAIFDVAGSFVTIDQLINGVADGSLTATHAASVDTLAFQGHGTQSLSDFLGDAGAVTDGDGSVAMTTMGMHFTGYIWLDAGAHSFTVRSDDGFALFVGEAEMMRYSTPRPQAATSASADFAAGLYQIDVYYYENGGSQALELTLDGAALKPSQLYTSIQSYQEAVAYDPAMDTIALTGTGLDQIVDWIASDGGLELRTLATDQAEAIEAAKGMNQIIVEAIKAIGAADDGTLSVAEVYDLADWINQNRYDDWVLYHGDDENGEETGFHLAQNDGATTIIYGENAINTVADGLYHLGFGYNGNRRLINEDGAQNVRVEEVADWLNHILADDLAAGSLTSGNDVAVTATTGTGLDHLTQVLATDQDLNLFNSESRLVQAAQAMNVMNSLILEGIHTLGYANDGVISAAEIAGLSDWVQADAARLATFIEAHGDEEGGVRTGFHIVQGTVADAVMFDANTINTVADGLYHMPFGYTGGRLLNEDGNQNAALSTVADNLTQLLANDLADLVNPDAEVVQGTTGTGLDLLVDRIWADSGLQARISMAEIATGAEAADQMNHIIVQSIQTLGYANDGTLAESEVRGLAEYIAANYAVGADSPWLVYHGDDENDEETGFHLVQNDGATSRIFNENLVNTVADGIYHLGFGYRGNRLINEDGNNNQTITDIADWLNTLLADDMASLVNSDVQTFTGTTGTGLDQWVTLIMEDIGLNQNVSITDITQGAYYADQINTMIVDGVIATGIARNGSFSAADIRTLSDYIAANYYGGDATSAFAIAHGDDENNEETGFHLVQNDGASARMYGENLVNAVLDGVYHLGFGYNSRGRLINEDGAQNQTLVDVAYWLEAALAVELTSGALVTEASSNPYVTGTTGTGLDALVDLIVDDQRLHDTLTVTQIAEAASAADALNTLLLEAITATDVARDGAFTASDLKDISVWLGQNYAEEWAALNGDSSSGFSLAMDARTALYGERAVSGVMDAFYNLGFGYKYDYVMTETGGYDVKLHEAALWLSDLLEAELADGSLVGVLPSVEETPVMTRTGLTVDGNSTAELRYVDATAEGSILTTFTLDTMNTNTRYTLFERAANGDAEGYFRVYVVNGDLRLDLRQGSASYYAKGDAPELEAGTEYSVAMTFDDDTVSVYLNGTKVLAFLNPGVDFAAMDAELMLGGSFSMGSAGQVYPWHVFDGQIASVAVYDTALENGQIAALDNSGGLDLRVQAGAVALAAETAGVGDGLNGALFDVDGTIGSIGSYRAQTDGVAADMTFTTDVLQFKSASSGTQEAFVASGAASYIGDGSAKADTFGLSLDGFIFAEAGSHTFDIESDDGFSLSIGGVVVSEFAGLRGTATTRAEVMFAETGYYAIDIDYFENGGAQVLKVEMDNGVLDDTFLFTELPDLV
ncbi:LamG-like jellyroll fold domain-containing protein [Donghicola tyrosinivorans]|uniref:PA14 domain-containing protein n=1 Tax=Donghicola tyrosinivorans TaxID=1652492 RepID=A0A2T0WD34_9RHOB|nr:LamG-like jellyroll fold domain-containing protein [Donghicola tyrosinivorans]PRY84611.1 PA14 domain-containing protein [Donghicola tyrosinivorans]